MYLEHRIALEEAERKKQYLESIGLVGRAFDSHIGFIAIMFLGCIFGFWLGFFIGLLL